MKHWTNIGARTSEAERREKNGGGGENQHQDGSRWSWQRRGNVLAVVWPRVCRSGTSVPAAAAACSGTTCRPPNLPGTLHLQETLALCSVVMRPQIMMCCILLGHGAPCSCCTPYAMGSKGEEQEEVESESAFPHLEMGLVTNRETPMFSLCGRLLL